MMPDERREIQLVHLADGLNQRELADRFGRTRETIGHVLKDDAFQAVKREIDAEVARQEALRGQQATNRAARAIDVVAQPHAARLLAPKPDTPAD